LYEVLIFFSPNATPAGEEEDQFANKPGLEDALGFSWGGKNLGLFGMVWGWVKYSRSSPKVD